MSPQVSCAFMSPQCLHESPVPPWVSSASMGLQCLHESSVSPWVSSVSISLQCPQLSPQRPHESSGKSVKFVSTRTFFQIVKSSENWDLRCPVSIKHNQCFCLSYLLLKRVKERLCYRCYIVSNRNIIVLLAVKNIIRNYKQVKYCDVSLTNKRSQ